MSQGSHPRHNVLIGIIWYNIVFQPCLAQGFLLPQYFVDYVILTETLKELHEHFESDGPYQGSTRV